MRKCPLRVIRKRQRLLLTSDPSCIRVVVIELAVEIALLRNKIRTDLWGGRYDSFGESQNYDERRLRYSTSMSLMSN